MITFKYKLIGTTADIYQPLLDSDHYWPPEWGHDSQGIIQLAQPTRGKSQKVYARGNVIVPIRFTTYRVFPNRSAAWRYAFITVPALNGQVGDLVITIPGGGSFTSVGCGCQSSPSRCNDVGVKTEWSFVGPRLT